MDTLPGRSELSRLYKCSVYAIGLVGVFALVIAIAMPRSSTDKNMLGALLIGALQIYAIFDFVSGNQKGHWVKATNVALATLIGIILAFGQSTEDYALSMKLLPLPVIGILILSVIYGRRFREEYSRYGKVDYFTRYFR